MAAAAVYVLGLFGKSASYKKVREAVGRVAMAAGVAVSAIGNSKLKILWNPIEQVFCDFLFFAVEQFAAGLRKDNPQKMEQQLGRLVDAGSITRADALAEKIYLLESTVPNLPPVSSQSRDFESAFLAHKLREQATETIRNKLHL